MKKFALLFLGVALLSGTGCCWSWPYSNGYGSGYGGGGGYYGSPSCPGGNCGVPGGAMIPPTGFYQPSTSMLTPVPGIAPSPITASIPGPAMPQPNYGYMQPGMPGYPQPGIPGYPQPSVHQTAMGGPINALPTY